MPASLSIVVPIRNEVHRLPGLFEALAGAEDTVFRQADLQVTDVIIVDDHSSDSSASLVHERSRLDPRIRLVTSRGPAGKGAAVRAGMLAASGSWALMTDVDLSAPLEDVSRLATALRGGADLAIGSRGLGESVISVHQPRLRETGGKLFNVLVRLSTGLPYRDTQCGFKLFLLDATRPLFEELRTPGFAFDVEILVAARRRGLRMQEVPIRWANNPDSRVDVARASARMTADVFAITVRDRRGQARRPRRADWALTSKGDG